VNSTAAVKTAMHLPVIALNSGYGKDERMGKFLDSLPWGLLIIACLTLGLAPYKPPHFIEKLQMLSKGRLVRPIDWFDFIMHGIPWFLLILKGIFSLKK
jgi:hypothetical protein